MFVITRVVIDIETGDVLEREGYEYSGPVAELKKGREQATAAANQGLALSSQAKGLADKYDPIQAGYRSQTDALGKGIDARTASTDAAAKTYFGAPDPHTGLGKYTTSQYELDKANIQKNASDAVSVGQKMLAARGFNNSPGAVSSLVNTSARNAGEQERQAYSDATNRQLGLGLSGIQYGQNQQRFGLERQGLGLQQQQLYSPLNAIQVATGSAGQAANAAALRNRMGSTLGDIGAGIQAGADMAGLAV